MDNQLFELSVFMRKLFEMAQEKIEIGPKLTMYYPLDDSGPLFPGAAIPSIRYPRITNNNHPSPKNSP